MNKFFLIPIEEVNNFRGPKYLQWRFGSGAIVADWSLMDYGFVPSALVLIRDIELATDTFLQAQPDVYTFPENLDQPVADPGIDAFFENINIPTDWLTPSTDYRELLRQLAGMFQFNQRYGGISGGASLFDTATLETRYNSLAPQERAWFEAALISFGWTSGVAGNPKLRQLVKQAGSFWESQTFVMGGIEF